MQDRLFEMEPVEIPKREREPELWVFDYAMSLGWPPPVSDEQERQIKRAVLAEIRRLQAEEDARPPMSRPSGGRYFASRRGKPPLGPPR